jgi:hypothetical protein
VTFDELLSALRGWTGRTVTLFATLTPGEGTLDDPITGTLYEGHAPVVVDRMRRAPAYEPTLDTVQFTLWREPVEQSRWPVGKTCLMTRKHTTAKWDTGREGEAIWISLAEGHTSLWVVEDG